MGSIKHCCLAAVFVGTLLVLIPKDTFEENKKISICLFNLSFGISLLHLFFCLQDFCLFDSCVFFRPIRPCSVKSYPNLLYSSFPIFSCDPSPCLFPSLILMFSMVLRLNVSRDELERHGLKLLLFPLGISVQIL